MTTRTTSTTTTDLYPTRLAAQPQVLDRREPVVRGSAEDGPFDAGGLDGLEQTGYAQIPELVTGAEVAAMTAELERLAEDPEVLQDERTVVESDSVADIAVRSIFQIHETNELFGAIARDPRVVDRARQVLGSDVYIHQSRVNFKPGYFGKDFFWHSDFETWHAEDGMPTPRAVSISISLTDNYTFNGPLMIMPGSHRKYVSCVGETPDDNYQQSLVMQGAGTPDRAILNEFADEYGIDVLTGEAGGATMFDSNCMHASNGNVTPFARSNVFLVFNSVENGCGEPYAASAARPDFLRAQDHTAV